MEDVEEDPARHQRPRVDHTYHDFSLFLDLGGKITKHKKSGSNFPAQLHLAMSDPRLSHIITWMVRSASYFYFNIKCRENCVVPWFTDVSKSPGVTGVYFKCNFLYITNSIQARQNFKVNISAWAHVSLVGGHQAGQVGFLRALRLPPQHKTLLCATSCQQE